MTQKSLLPTSPSLARRQNLGHLCTPLGAMILAEWIQLREHQFGTNYQQDIVLRGVKMS